MPELRPSSAVPAEGLTSPPAGAVPEDASHPLLRLPARAAEGLVWTYQKTLSPVLAAAFPSWGCRFAPTCSHYARGALREHGLFVGGALAVARLARCGPWRAGGFDPVPPRRPACARVAR